MPWKLIFFILCLIIAAVFTGLNLGNSCDINFGFSRLEKVPVFFTSFLWDSIPRPGKRATLDPSSKKKLCCLNSSFVRF